MSYQIFFDLCSKYNLSCFRQEVINWRTVRAIDCFSTFCHKNSKFDKSYMYLINTNYMKEAENIKFLSNIY